MNCKQKYSIGSGDIHSGKQTENDSQQAKPSQQNQIAQSNNTTQTIQFNLLLSISILKTEITYPTDLNALSINSNVKENLKIFVLL